METSAKITNLLLSHLNNQKDDSKDILDSLHTLLNGHYVKYDFNAKVCMLASKTITDESLQKLLFNLNEKTVKRKTNGVYYTPSDVVDYILYNTVIMNLFPDLKKTFKKADAESLLLNLDIETAKSLLFKKSFIDPTCGSGEFLVKILEMKLLLLMHYNLLTDANLISICKTIFGNDIDEDSTDICKIRIFFTIAKQLKSKLSLNKLALVLKAQFYNCDFVSLKNFPQITFDIVVGNPPYVEYGKIEDKSALINSFGNIYADIIKNSLSVLRNKGSLGFIIPLSYTATERMKGIRSFVKDNTTKQYILNFADRPDCLFQGVHQKLNIIVANKGKTKQPEVYVSNYKHWYKEERPHLLNGCEIIRMDKEYQGFIPKIGNTVEQSIFNKIICNDGHSLFSLQSKTNSEPVYLNMRACFWIKAFSSKQSSNEYKQFNYDKTYKAFFTCVLNSSLFWLYWTIVSDCWHITSKELKGFAIPKLPSPTQNKRFEELLKLLEDRLEKTKIYIGSKQTEYAYKHKECKKEIDAIDDELTKIYGFTKEELNYIKTFAEKYRLGSANA